MLFQRDKGIPVAEYAPLLCDALWDAVEAANNYDEFGKAEPVENETRETGLQAFWDDIALLRSDADQLEITRARFESQSPKYKSVRYVHFMACRVIKYVYFRDVALTAAYSALMRGENKNAKAAAFNHKIYAAGVSKYWGMFLFSLNALQKKHPDLYQVLDFPADLWTEMLRLANASSASQPWLTKIEDSAM
jgi:hypothetical protein